jgi:hypothetical protein
MPYVGAKPAPPGLSPAGEVDGAAPGIVGAGDGVGDGREAGMPARLVRAAAFFAGFFEPALLALFLPAAFRAVFFLPDALRAGFLRLEALRFAFFLATVVPP